MNWDEKQIQYSATTTLKSILKPSPEGRPREGGAGLFAVRRQWRWARRSFETRSDITCIWLESRTDLVDYFAWGCFDALRPLSQVYSRRKLLEHMIAVQAAVALGNTDHLLPVSRRWCDHRPSRGSAPSSFRFELSNLYNAVVLHLVRNSFCLSTQPAWLRLFACSKTAPSAISNSTCSPIAGYFNSLY